MFRRPRGPGPKDDYDSGGCGGGGGGGGGAAASEAKKNSLLQGDTDSGSKPASLTVSDKVAACHAASRAARASPDTEGGSAGALHLRDKDKDSSRVSHRPQFGFATPKATASYTVAAQARTETTTSKSSSWSAPSPQLRDSQTGAPSLTPAPQESARNRPAAVSYTHLTLPTIVGV